MVKKACQYEPGFKDPENAGESRPLKTQKGRISLFRPASQ
jgi:hypothetical protein